MSKKNHFNCGLSHDRRAKVKVNKGLKLRLRNTPGGPDTTRMTEQNHTRDVQERDGQTSYGSPEGTQYSKIE